MTGPYADHSAASIDEPLGQVSHPPLPTPCLADAIDANRFTQAVQSCQQVLKKLDASSTSAVAAARILKALALAQLERSAEAQETLEGLPPVPLSYVPVRRLLMVVAAGLQPFSPIVDPAHGLRPVGD